jgi:16S rRNA (adenine1518-N6/adenine1519-N6)-dimethyltransferase
MQIQAKKRFGQHFLRDTGVLDRMVRFIRPGPEDLFVEIGAGDGALTTRLAPHVRQLIAVEIDRDCIPRLESAVSGLPSVSIRKEDILGSNLEDFWSQLSAPQHPLRFGGNLPYNISTAIIEKLLSSELPVADMVFMVQLEVAERIAASPGSKEYGYFSVFCGHRASVQMGFKVSPACFVPRPKVISAVVSLKPEPRRFDKVQEARFLRVTKAAFAHRRKTLLNSLRADPALGALAVEMLARAGIDGGRRPEQLAVSEYERLSECL